MMVGFEIRALLIVSDDAMADTIISILKRRGIKKFFHADYTQKAVGAMLETQFNLVIIDGNVLVSPEKKFITDAGIDFIRFIRICDGPVSEATVVYLRGGRMLRNLIEASLEMKEAEDAGANIILAQPFTIEKFDAEITPHLSSPASFIRSVKYTGPCRRKKKKGIVKERRKMVNRSSKNTITSTC